MRKLLVLVLLLMLFSMAFGQSTTAPPEADPRPQAEPAGLSLSPAVIQASGQPGQSFTQTLTLHNQTGMTLNFDMLAQDVVVRQGKRVFVGAGEVPHSIAATAVFSQPQVQVGPHERASVDVTVTLPQGTPIRAMVAIFRGTNRIRTGSNALGMTASLGTLVTFTASQNFAVQGGSMQIEPQTDSRPLVFKESLSNTGTEPVIVEGVLALVRSTGGLVGKTKFAPQRLLPGEQLPFEAEYASMLTAGHYRALATYQFEDKTVTNSTEFDVP